MRVRAPGFAGIIGVAAADITPPVGIAMRNWGAQTHEVSTGNMGTLGATVWTIQDAPDVPPLILAALDLGWWRVREDEWFVREPLVALAGDEARVVINLCHTHSGPSITRQDGGLVPGYLAMVRERLAEAARRALAEARERTLDFVLLRHPFAANRDLRVGGRFAVGYNPQAPADDVAIVGTVYEDGAARSTLVNLALHPTMIGPANTRVSADFVASLREARDPHEPLLFLQGASGDLAPRLNYQRDGAAAHDLGTGLALFVEAAAYAEPTSLELVEVVDSGAPLAVWQKVEEVPRRTVGAKLLKVPLALKISSDAEGDDGPARERRSRQEMVRRWVGGGESFDLPVGVWQVGDASFVATPAEAYSLLQIELRRRFPERIVLVSNVSNGWVGYLPTQKMYDEDVYSVNQTPFARGSLEALIEACAREIETHG
ncbi:hypothetical protein BH11ARM2_BH11ARM2_18890 [soil metagenome]